MKLFAFNQTQYLLISFVCGFFLGILYEIFRILRKAFSHAYIAVFCEDVLFFVISSLCYWIVAFGAANGQIRWFSLVFCAAGFIVYLYTLGKIVARLSDLIIKAVKSVISRVARAVKKIISILLTPINKLIRRILCIADKARITRSKKKFYKAAKKGFR